MNLFFEVIDRQTDTQKYFAVYNIAGGVVMNAACHRLMRIANRVWVEDDNSTWFVKNRVSRITPVNMEEFFWVKLKSETV